MSEPVVGPPDVRHVVAVGSGKGGVGKSTISLNLALTLAREGAAVGLLDADFYGPNIPVMVGLTRTHPAGKWSFWSARGGLRIEPVERFGIRIMSVGFLLAERQQIFSWGSLVGQLAYQMVHHVDWGELDYLVIDLPPGAAEAQQELLQALPLSGGNPGGAVVVVGPQDVAHLDAKKVIEMFRAMDVPVLGGVENMGEARCPCCGGRFDLFPRVREERSIWAMNVPRLGSVPLDPRLAHDGDRAAPVVVSHPNGEQASVFWALADTVVRRLQKP